MMIDNNVPKFVFNDVEVVLYPHDRALVITVNQCGVCRLRMMLAIEGPETEAIRARVSHELSIDLQQQAA